MKLTIVLAAFLLSATYLSARAQDKVELDEGPAAQKPKAVAAEPAASTATPAPTAPSAPAAPSAPVLPAAVAAPAPEKEAVNVCSYTGAIGRLYEDITRDAKEFTAQWQASVAALKKKEADIVARLEKKNQEIEEKQLDTSKAAKDELKVLKKAAKQLSKDLAAVQKQTKREVDTAMTRMAEMYKRHLDSIKAKYKEVEGRIRTAQDQ